MRFLELCCSSDSELAALVVEHSVVIRITSFEDFQLTSRRPALHRLLMICKAYEACEVVANIWVSIPCIAGTPFRRINEKLGAETSDLAMTYKLEVAAVGLCRHDVRIGDRFSWEWSNGTELWKSVVVLREERQLLMFGLHRSCGTTICRSRTATDSTQWVQPYAMVVHSDSSRHAAEEADAKFCKGELRVHQRVAKHHHGSHREQPLGSVRRDLSGCRLTITSLRTCSCQGPG